MKKQFLLILAILVIPTLVVGATVDTKLVNKLKGRILLQVQQHGEAWYVNPTDGKRYYMKDGAAAYEMLRKFGQGITDTDISKIPVGSLDGSPASQSLPVSNSVPAASPNISTTKIDGLTAIRFSGGTWDNWDADVENDGPVFDLVYLDSQGNIITNDITTKLPITADVKLYASSGPLAIKNKLVFSAHYSANQIILGSIYPRIRVPKEQMSINPSVDYKYGAAEVTIQTPEQGAFSSRSDFVVLYE
ncbi:MAG: hypothetical protein V1846_01305 [Candidatus Komeilibacteria bacterium]